MKYTLGDHCSHFQFVKRDEYQNIVVGSFYRNQ